MITTVDNSERVFAVYGQGEDCTTPALCNLHDLKEVCSKRAPITKVKHFWIGELKNLSKKDGRDMLKGAGLPYNFYPFN